ncbi:hypothetical protein BVC80_1743g11 [Macleaya cordata]|uniref:Protein POLYCHOME n=1 Tax=Macleaya cordata TaxID=56857 RepID=A0A200QKY1_MACCD|nr:hypothetical protein BVC80_1743g11 [Macleaya cordata]
MNQAELTNHDDRVFNESGCRELRNHFSPTKRRNPKPQELEGMAEPRDRLVREDPLTPILMSGRRSIGGVWQDFGSERSSSRLSVGGGRNLFGSPFQSTTRSMEISPSQGVWMRRNGSYGTPRVSRIGSELRRNLYGTPLDVRENPMFSGTRRRSGGRGGRPRNTNPLPSWYPRTPLRDITAVVNAIERRRAQMSEADRHRLANPSPLESSVLGPNLSFTGALLEPEISLTTPNLKAAIKGHHTPAHRLPKIFLDNYATEESDFMTPQKKLLNSIDQVEKVVMEEFRRMKRTPSAKKAERAKKVRTLMAMR